MLDSGNKQKSFDDLYNDKNCKFRGYNCQIKQIYGLSFLVYTLVSSKERKINCNTADDSDKEMFAAVSLNALCTSVLYESNIV